MHFYILKFDRSVEVVTPETSNAILANVNHPKGQLFIYSVNVSDGYKGERKPTWLVLHRDFKGQGPLWRLAQYVPKELRFVQMLVN